MKAWTLGADATNMLCLSNKRARTVQESTAEVDWKAYMPPQLWDKIRAWLNEVDWGELRVAMGKNATGRPMLACRGRDFYVKMGYSIYVRRETVLCKCHEGRHVVESIQFFKNSPPDASGVSKPVLYRHDGPARIDFFPFRKSCRWKYGIWCTTMCVARQVYCKHPLLNKPHDCDNAAMIYYNLDGSISHGLYYEMGELLQNDRPFCVSIHADRPDGFRVKHFLRNRWLVKLIYTKTGKLVKKKYTSRKICKDFLDSQFRVDCGQRSAEEDDEGEEDEDEDEDEEEQDEGKENKQEEDEEDEDEDDEEDEEEEKEEEDPM
jgi:hypothetical protein